MNKLDFDWISLLRFAGATEGAKLKAAFLTTYDHPDESFLAEHFLPALLRLEHECSRERKENQFFLLELDQRLKELHARIAIVSSFQREMPEADRAVGVGYPWIWRSMRHFGVGRTGKAVQHAKLWLFHWGSTSDDARERLEMVVSSANLTHAAFRNQLQAAWRCVVVLDPQWSGDNQSSWGLLPNFLRALGEAIGDDVLTDRFVRLLGRASCPTGIRFVSSVPGSYEISTLRRTPWGAAGLSQITPPGVGSVGVRVLSPYIGAWDEASLKNWCARFRGRPERLELVWVDRNHPWAEQWRLPAHCLDVLTKLKVELKHLRFDPGDERKTDRFHKMHRGADARWSHAKLYALRCGSSRRLLLTSANFSPAAWGRSNGKGGLKIDNFELGVSVDRADWPLNEVPRFADLSEIAVVDELPPREAVTLLWASAGWDGDNVFVECRCELNEQLRGAICAGDIRHSIPAWQTGEEETLLHASMPWCDAQNPPAEVLLETSADSLRIPVFDNRSLALRNETLPDGIDSDVAQRIRDALLFERYGDWVADDVDETDADVIFEEEVSTDESVAPNIRDSYAVEVFELARRYMEVVDVWAARYERICRRDNEPEELEVLQQDGIMLCHAFERQSLRDGARTPVLAVGARLAVEEMELRLKAGVGRD